MTKMGCPRTEPRQGLKRTSKPINKVSKKQSKENREYSKFKSKMIELSNNKSELSGEFGSYLDLHHFAGRGKNLCNPFTVVVCNRREHDIEQRHMSYRHKQELRAFIKPLRLKQGFKEVKVRC